MGWNLTERRHTPKIRRWRKRQLLRPDPNGADFLWPLYSYKNPTFPTFEAEVIDYATLILVG